MAVHKNASPFTNQKKWKGILLLHRKWLLPSSSCYLSFFRSVCFCTTQLYWCYMCTTLRSDRLMCVAKSNHGILRIDRFGSVTRANAHNTHITVESIKDTFDAFDMICCSLLVFWCQTKDSALTHSNAQRTTQQERQQKQRPKMPRFQETKRNNAKRLIVCASLADEVFDVFALSLFLSCSC